MEINLTLLAQMVHFFLAWLLIQKLLLEPALKAIADERHEYQQRKNAIDAIQQEYEQKSTYKQEQWKECQRQFAAGVPAGINTLHLQRMAHIPDKAVDEAYRIVAKKEDIKEIAQVLTKRIEHIHD